MNNTRIDASKEILWKRTSDRMASQLWYKFVEKYPDRLKDVDYSYRLRVAHTLLLQFFSVYFNRTHKHPTPASQRWLIRKVFNQHNTVHWPIVEKL